MESRVESTATNEELREASANKLVSELKTMIQRAEQIAAERAKAADRVVRDHPYQTIGVAFGLGLLIGFLVHRK